MGCRMQHFVLGRCGAPLFGHAPFSLLPAEFPAAELEKLLRRGSSVQLDAKLQAGGAGEIDEGRALLEEELEFTPGDADLLNASCWYDGIWDRVTEETIDRCTRAIEGLDNSLEALDSRALALFRLGRNDEALRDLDRVLTIDPEMDGSRYLRGVIRSHSGDAAGAREDIEIVRWASPYTPRQYALWGLEPG